MTLILTPVVSAQIMDGVEDTLSIIFDATGDLIYIKAGFWVILLFFIFKSAERILPGSRGTAMLIACVISTLGVRYMPEEYWEYFRTWFLFIIIFGMPYFLGSMLGDLLRFRRKGKAFLVIAGYVLCAYFLLELRGVIFQEEASNILYDVLNWMQENIVITLIIIGIICIYFLRRTMRRSEPVANVPPTIESRPSFWSGFGGRARGTGQLAKQSLIRGSRWLARRRALAKQRAMLKAGWKQKETELARRITQMPKGKYIKKGTQGYELLRQRQRQLAKARKRQGKEAGFKN